MSVDDFIEALGGTGAVALLVGVGDPAVSMWRKCGAIPPKHYFLLKGIARKKRIPCPDILFAAGGRQEVAAE